MNYLPPANKARGTGMTWKYGPPAAARSGQIRSGLGNYMPLPRAGAPEPLGCYGGARTLEYRPWSPPFAPCCNSCSRGGSCDGGDGFDIGSDLLVAAVTAGVVVFGAALAGRALAGLFKKD